MGNNRRTPGHAHEHIPMETIDNLTFAGGGVKGIVYVGALEEMEARGILKDVKRVGGTSAGGITALLVGLGFTPPEIKKIMWGIDLRDFQDLGKELWERVFKKFGSTKLLAGIDVVDLLKILVKDKHGISKGEAFHNWAKKIIAERLGKPDATFRDLREAMRIDPTLKDMMFTGCDISGIGSALTYFSFETTPDVKIADAVRATMSYPGAFEPFDIQMGDQVRTFVDGGLVVNDPREFYDHERFLPPGEHLAADGTNKRTLGLRVDAIDSINRLKWNIPGARRPLEKLSGFVEGLARGAVDEALKGQHKIREKYGMVSIQIPDLGLKALDFDISADTKNQLIRSGRMSTREWLNLYRGPEVLRDIVIHENLVEKYRTKNEIQKKDAVHRLREEYHRLQTKGIDLEEELERSQDEGERREIIKRAEKNNDRLEDILEELKIIKQLSPEVFKTESNDELLIKSAKKLLKMKSQLAEQNEKNLQEIQKVYSDAVRDYQELYESYITGLNFLQEIAQEPVMRETVEELLSDLKIFQHRRKRLAAQLEEPELIHLEVDPRLKKQYENLMTLEPKRILRKAEILLNQRDIVKRHGAQGARFALGFIRSELERVKKNNVEKDLDTLIQDCLRQKNDHFHILKELSEGRQKCDAEMKKLIDKRRVLESNRKSVGKDFGKIIDLAGELTKFIKEQDTKFVSFFDFTAYILDKFHTFLKWASFGTLPLLELVGSFIARKIGQWTGLTKKLEEIGVTENLLVPNKVLYFREAQKLRDEIQKIIDEIGTKEPRKALRAYDEILAKEKLVLERGIKWFGGANQKKLLDLIEASKSSLSRIASEEKQKLESEMQSPQPEMQPPEPALRGLEPEIRRPAERKYGHEPTIARKYRQEPLAERKYEQEPPAERKYRTGLTEETQRTELRGKRNVEQKLLISGREERKLLEQKRKTDERPKPKSGKNGAGKWPPRPRPSGNGVKS